MWLLLTGCVVGGGESEWLFPDATALSANFASGEVRVESWSEGDAHLLWEGGGIGEVAFPDVWQGDTGCVFVDADGGFGGGELRARIPEGAPVVVYADSGDVEVDLDAPADVDVCVGAGDVTITVPPGAYALDVDLAVGAVSTGVVHDPDAEHSISACVGAGEISVRTAE